MKKNLLFIFALAFAQILNAQTLKETKIGKSFFLSSPDYMTRVFGLNESATFSNGNYTLGVFTMVFQEEKANLIGNEVDAATKDKYYATAYETLKGSGTILNETAPKNFKIGNFDAKQVEVSIELEVEDSDPIKIFYVITVIETPEYMYKIYSWTSDTEKAKYTSDFKKVANSFRE